MIEKTVKTNDEPSSPGGKWTFDDAFIAETMRVCPLDPPPLFFFSCLVPVPDLMQCVAPLLVSCRSGVVCSLKILSFFRLLFLVFM